MLNDTSVSEIIQFGLHQYMLQIQDQCGELSQEITRSYFQARSLPLGEVVQEMSV
jgi:uncharacterized alpha-E superfamily protein